MNIEDTTEMYAQVRHPVPDELLLRVEDGVAGDRAALVAARRGPGAVRRWPRA